MRDIASFVTDSTTLNGFYDKAEPGVRPSVNSAPTTFQRGRVSDLLPVIKKAVPCVVASAKSYLMEKLTEISLLRRPEISKQQIY